ncbi:hypothetical protein PUN28_002931 [Cardiocondyla obscurior]|uniref:Uncharacterized protein n=1 Tax=Cardiocondyla obscurior TaxID=286306 RepID=A0AAW2GWY1_9HYME
MAIGRGRIDVDEYVECERHRGVPLVPSPLSPLTASGSSTPSKIKSPVLLPQPLLCLDIETLSRCSTDLNVIFAHIFCSTRSQSRVLCLYLTR